MQTLLPGTEVTARGLRWELVFVQPAGAQAIYRLRCLEGGPELQGREIDLLHPFEYITPVATEFAPTTPGPPVANCTRLAFPNSIPRCSATSAARAGWVRPE